MIRAIAPIVCLTLCGSSLLAADHLDVPVEKLGSVEVVKSGEHRFGAKERMFLIEDQWEYDRCKLLLPKLPAIDVRKESLLVIMSWKSRARSLLTVESEGEAMVIRVQQQKSPRWSSGPYYPPDFHVFKLPLWSGPVLFEVNDKPQFTILRGKALEERSAELWEEILRIHSGGDATLQQIMDYYERRAPGMPKEEISRHISTDMKKHRSYVSASLNSTLFRELIDIRARPTIPRIFDLIESMGPHDQAFNPAWQAVVGIGGPDVVDHCKKALSSWNPRSRHAAMLILRELGLPGTRPLAQAHLVDIQNRAVGRCAVDLLYRLGVTKGDIPAMVKALEEISAFHLTPLNERPKLNYSDDLGHEIMVVLGSMGPEAEEALPVLEKLAENPDIPAVAKDDAKKAIEKIRATALPATP